MIVKDIGRGAQSKVKLVINQYDDKMYALKITKR